MSLRRIFQVSPASNHKAFYTPYSVIFDSQNAFLMEGIELPLCGHPDNNREVLQHFKQFKFTLECLIMSPRTNASIRYLV